MSSDGSTGFAAHSAHSALTDAGEGYTFSMFGTSMRLLATAAGTDGRCTVLEQITPPGWGPPRHVHAREDEIVYILEGTYEVSVGAECRTVSAGGCAVLPRGIPHGFRNVGAAPGRLLAVNTPGGLEEYFLTIGQYSPPPSPAQLSEIAKPYGLTLLPPGA